MWLRNGVSGPSHVFTSPPLQVELIGARLNTLASAFVPREFSDIRTYLDRMAVMGDAPLLYLQRMGFRQDVPREAQVMDGPVVIPARPPSPPTVDPIYQQVDVEVASPSYAPISPEVNAPESMEVSVEHTASGHSEVVPTAPISWASEVDLVKASTSTSGGAFVIPVSHVQNVQTEQQIAIDARSFANITLVDNRSVTFDWSSVANFTAMQVVQALTKVDIPLRDFDPNQMIERIPSRMCNPVKRMIAQ